MGQVAHRVDFGHACAALEGVQVPLQRGQGRGVFGFQQPALERLPGAVEDVYGLFKKDLDNLVVHRGGVIQLRSSRAQLGDTQGAAAVAFDQARGGRVQGFVQQLAQRLQPCGRGADFLAGGQLVEHVDQRVVGLFSLVEEPGADRQAAFFYRAIQVEQGLAQRVDRVQVGKVSALAQRSQLVQQCRELLTVAGVLLPAAQQAFGVEQDVHALGQEVGDQVRVTLDAQAGRGRVEQGGKLMLQQVLGAADHAGRTVDRCQGIVVQVTHPALEQPLCLKQQRHFVLVQRQAVGLVLTGEVIQRARQLGDGQHASHVGAALEGVQGALQFIADLQRHLLGGLLQEVAEAVQMALGFVAEDLQQHWVMGLGGRRCSATGQGMGTGGQGVGFIALALIVAGKIGDQLRQQGHSLIQHLLHLRAKD